MGDVVTFVALTLSFIAAVCSGCCFGYVLVDSQPFRTPTTDYNRFVIPVGIAGFAWAVAALWMLS